jgi:hypothetical protein
MHPLRGRSDWCYEHVASGREDYYAERGGATTARAAGWERERQGSDSTELWRRVSSA